MPVGDPQGVRNQTLNRWPTVLLSILPALALAAVFFHEGLRREIVEAVVNAGAYLAWSVDLLGGIIPQQILWFLLLLAILYIAVGSFYGKERAGGRVPLNAAPLEGPVERLARWIENRGNGIYFIWQIANLLGHIHRHLRESASRGTAERIPPPAPQIQAYLEAGLTTTYADYPLRGIFGRDKLVFDIPLEPVVDYIEAHLEIEHEHKNQ